MNVLLNTLLQRATITVQGKGEVKAEISLRNFLVIKEWLFSIDVKISRDLGLGDIICKLWSSAEEAIEKVPNLKEALNSVKIGVYVGGKFQAFPDIESGEDVFSVSVYMGISASIEIGGWVSVGGGLEISFNMKFQASGNNFIILILFSLGLDVSLGVATLKWENENKVEYNLGPGSSEGTQMNHDSDGDGLSDDYEKEIGTDPNKDDSDNDGIKDGLELAEYFTDPLDPDSDNDGLKDSEEKNYGTNPTKSDTDEDGLSDKVEIERGLNPCTPDTDSDGWPDNIDVDPKSCIIPNIPLIAVVISLLLLIWKYALRKKREE